MSGETTPRDAIQNLLDHIGFPLNDRWPETITVELSGSFVRAAREAHRRSLAVASQQGGERKAARILEDMLLGVEKLAVSTRYDTEDRRRWQAVADDCRAVLAALHSPAPIGGGEVERLREVVRAMLRRHASATQNWTQAAVDAQRDGNRELSVQIQNLALTALEGFPIDEARAALAPTPDAGEQGGAK